MLNGETALLAEVSGCISVKVGIASRGRTDLAGFSAGLFRLKPSKRASRLQKS
jgi:hypothetical protein